VSKTVENCIIDQINIRTDLDPLERSELGSFIQKKLNFADIFAPENWRVLEHFSGKHPRQTKEKALEVWEGCKRGHSSCELIIAILLVQNLAWAYKLDDTLRAEIKAVVMLGIELPSWSSEGSGHYWSGGAGAGVLEADGMPLSAYRSPLGGEMPPKEWGGAED